MFHLLRVYRAINKSLEFSKARYTHTLIPVVQWVLALSAYSDLSRPANMISKNESFAITIFGFVTATHSICIKPYNVYQFVPCMVISLIGLKQIDNIFSFEKEFKNSEKTK